MTNVERVEPVSRRRPTTTSAFGVGRREAHDASSFYARFTPPRLSDDSHVEPHSVRDAIWVGDAREMDRYGAVADNSVALVVTSPPYFAGKEYERGTRRRPRARRLRRLPRHAPRRLLAGASTSSSPVAASRSTWPTWVASPTAPCPGT